MEKELQKLYLTNYSFLIAQKLWQAYYQILLTTEGIHKSKCKHKYDDEKFETFEIKYKDCRCYLEYANFYIFFILFFNNTMKMLMPQ